jgi:hypothetical protein
MSNVFDQFDAAPTGGAPNVFDQFDPPKETLLEHIAGWPKRIAGAVGDAFMAGPKLMGDVMEGRVDPNSPEAIERSADAAAAYLPGSPAYRTGGAIARRALAPGAANPEFAGAAASPGLRAAQTAADLDAPLPAGLVSENKGVQAATQAARSMPFVGGALDQRVADTIDAAGNEVKGIAEDLSGGVPDRATAGASLRPSLQGVIDDNKGRIGAAYDALRHVIDPDQVAELPRTKAAVQGVIARRVDAKMANPTAGLDDVLNLVKQPAQPEIGPTVLRGTEALNDVMPEQPWGASFNGLQRARTAISDKIDFADPHAGFNAGDLKIIRGAMSADMENVVRATARDGVHPDDAAAVLRAANAGTSRLIENNKTVQKLLNLQSDESRVGSVINAAQDKTGNARLLAQLRSQMPKEDFEQIVGVGLSELGHNPATGQFSLAKFGTGYRKLGDTAKSILFPDPAHRQALDSIANLDAVLKNSDQYINKSGTGRVDTLTKMLGAGGAIATAAAAGNVPAVLGALAGGAGGFGLAKYLGRPATASALAKWAKAAQNAPRTGPTGQAMLGIASRNLLSNLSDVSVKRLPAPASDDNGPNANGVAQPKRPKVQERYPQ